MVSNRKIDRIGDLLKKEVSPSPDDLRALLDWRNHFSPILEYYHTKIKNSIDDKTIVALAKRLKRIESIQIKLKRFRTMRLSTIQDIAGVRVVLTNEKALMSAFSALRNRSSRNLLKRLDDYHASPKDDGYRGMHLIYENAHSTMIEIQLRTELEHIWATAVEIYGELQSTSFKTGEGDDDWKAFFLLLSSYFAIKENCAPAKKHQKLRENQIRSKLKKTIKSMHVIEKLNAATNGVQVIVSKYNEVGKVGKYAILELNHKNKTTSIEIFNKKDMHKAIEIYTTRELNIGEDKQRNIVFVNIESLEKIQQSYPNYFLNTQKLLEVLAKIVLDEY